MGKTRKTVPAICEECGKEFIHRAEENTKFCSRECYWEAKRAGKIKSERHEFKIDLTGQRFGMLIAIKPTEHRQHGKVLWLCKCDCGVLCEKQSTKLKSGRVQSCGNHSSEFTKQRNITHRMTNTRLHRIWTNMKSRCYNPNRNCAKYYMERNIEVCDIWKDDFIAFYNWAINNGYAEDLTLDRIDNDKGYSPENCRWATWHEQRMNQRRMKNVLQAL